MARQTIAIDITTDANDPRLVCLDCADRHDGEAIREGDAWGTDRPEIRCAACGAEILGLEIVRR